MDFIIFYIVGCILAYGIRKNYCNEKVDTTKNKVLNSTVLLSWITVVKHIFKF